MGDGVGEKTRKWGRNIKHGVGFFHAAAVIAATEEEGEQCPNGRSRTRAGMVAAEAGKNSHFWSRFVVLPIFWHCQPSDRKWLGMGG